jgi:hypothetical protein
VSPINNTLGGGFGNGVVPENLDISKTAKAVKLIRCEARHGSGSHTQNQIAGCRVRSMICEK